jgi:beta-lactamase class A
MNSMRRLTILAFLLLSAIAHAQQSLPETIAHLAAQAQGKVSVACSLPGSALNCDLNPHAHPPMQSVFKAPLALFVLSRVEAGQFTLDQPIRFEPSDRILPHAYSPLWDKYPNANFDVPLRELLRLAVSLSDNVAADILLRITGGPIALQRYMDSLQIHGSPFHGFHIQDSEKGLHSAVEIQYRNWFEPAAAVQFLRLLADHSPVKNEHTALLLGWMQSSRLNTRIGGDLPAGVTVAHKSGTSDTVNGLTFATNDIALITLPDHRTLAIAVFVTDSRADDTTRDKVIASIARAAYDAATAVKP